ncbi:MAG TPA: helix-turn-helix domain-containing protein, partial [Ktedonobacteraceae bacterium]
PTEHELLGYQILFLRGKIAALDAIADRHWDLLAPPLPPINLHVEVNEFEKMHLEEALKLKRGNKTKAAAMLGMSKRIFVYRCSQLGLLSGEDEGGYADARKFRSTRNKLIREVHPLNTDT